MSKKLPKYLSRFFLMICMMVSLQATAQRFGDNLGNHSATDTLRMRGFNLLQAGGITIGTYNFLNNSVALQIDAVNKAVLIPRINDTTAISNPVNGMLVYSLANETFYVRQGGRWITFGSISNGVTTLNGRVGSLVIGGTLPFQFYKMGIV